MQIDINILESQIKTDNPKILNALSELYSFSDPGARYTPAYKKGYWDGKQRFLSAKTGKFGTGLLSRLLKDLEKIDCYPDLNYLYTPDPDDIFDFTLEPWDFRDYQTDAVAEALNKRRAVIKSPTGSGKTLMIAALIKALKGKKILVLFNQKQLIKQTLDYLTKPYPDGVNLSKYGMTVGVAFGEGYSYGDVMLASVFSLSKIIGTPHEKAEVLIVDEIHEFSQGKLTSGAISAFPMAEYRFGFTATPPTDLIRSFRIESGIGPVLEVASIHQLIDQSLISEPIIEAIELEGVPEYVARSERMSYGDIYREFIVNNEARNHEIVRICKEISESHESYDKIDSNKLTIVNSSKQELNKLIPKVLIITQSINHSRILNKLISNSYQIEGITNLNNRNKLIKEFKDSKQAKVLIGTKILQTGVNIPEITHFINARGLKSEIATIQVLGRALRKYKNQKYIYCYDFIDDAKYLVKHSRNRLKTYKDQGHTVNITRKVKYGK